MARIKVTGYLEPEDMRPEDVDLGHEMGVSNDFFEGVSTGARPLPFLTEVEFEKVED